MLDNLNLEAIQDENARQLIHQLLNLIEQLMADLRDAQAEIQRLRDENNRLKGEQGQPEIKGNVRKPAPEKHSSEQERRQPRERHTGSKNVTVKIDREEVLTLDRNLLPQDAEFKGYEDVVVQDLIIQTDNVRFRKEKFYARSSRQTYLAPLPAGYHGQFGPGIKALILTQYYGLGATEPKIHAFLQNLGIHISVGEISNLLIQKQDGFHEEKAAVYEAGLASSVWQQTDDTLTRVNGENHSCHVVCNPLYSAYFTRPTKDRLTVLDVLRHGRARCYRLNAAAMELLKNVQLSRKVRRILESWQSETELDEVTFLARLDTDLPQLSARQRQWVLGAAAIAAYHAQTDFPVVQTLVCDDAPQFNWLTGEMMLCWVHEGRHYKKLSPFVPAYQQALADFLTQFWSYYERLLAYQQQPTPEAIPTLTAEFDQLFATRTGYLQLDRQIAKTQAKKASLLLVLQHPELPLHNNAAELAVRQRVRKRDISFGPRTQTGKEAWDTFMTLAETTRKLGVSFFAYLQDRIHGFHAIPPLAELIEKEAQELNLSQSWSAA